MAGKHLRIVTPLDAADGAVEALAQRPQRALPDHPEVAAFRRHFPRAALFLDLETCGFAGSAIFLIGVVTSGDDGLAVEQLFARTYVEERAILETLRQRVAESDVLVSFNGKSFDWPMVRDRSTLHRLVANDELVHFDLVHHARRRWKKRLPNCRLQTLEYYLCGRRRDDDIPGARIPAAYHDYVRTGDARELRVILRHNLLDLVTLVELAVRIAKS